jgi:hypothetical protein
MKKVGVPYEMQEGKLHMPPVNWPVRCPCCGNDNANAYYKLECKARDVSVTTGTGTATTYYPLEWQVPYCENCRTHATRVTNLLVIIVLLVLISPIVLSIALGVVSDSMSVLIIVVSSILVGVILYQVLLRVMVYSKMTNACIHYREAIYATSDEQRIFFHFFRDDQAALFAQANNSEPEDDEKPNFWSLKKN